MAMKKPFTAIHTYHSIITGAETSGDTMERKMYWPIEALVSKDFSRMQ
jgi:hypothetical protein